MLKATWARFSFLRDSGNLRGSSGNVFLSKRGQKKVGCFIFTCHSNIVLHAPRKADKSSALSGFPHSTLPRSTSVLRIRAKGVKLLLHSMAVPGAAFSSRGCEHRARSEIPLIRGLCCHYNTKLWKQQLPLLFHAKSPLTLS